MKLGEALIIRSDMQQQIAQLQHRMSQNAIYQKGYKPAEPLKDLIHEFERLMDELEKLISQINKTNNETALAEGTLAEAITRREGLKKRIKTYQQLQNDASPSQMRYSSSEILFIPCIDASELQKEIDALSKAYRELDTNIQALNWTVDLLT